jgi:hypothetical protein
MLRSGKEPIERVLGTPRDGGSELGSNIESSTSSMLSSDEDIAGVEDAYTVLQTRSIIICPLGLESALEPNACFVLSRETVSEVSQHCSTQSVETSEWSSTHV